VIIDKDMGSNNGKIVKQLDYLNTIYDDSNKWFNTFIHNIKHNGGGITGMSPDVIDQFYKLSITSKKTEKTDKLMKVYIACYYYTPLHQMIDVNELSRFTYNQIK